MDGIQRERMERNRQSALSRLLARNLQNGGDSSEASEPGALRSQPNFQSENVDPDSLDVFEGSNTDETSSGVEEEQPRLSPMRLRVESKLTQSTLSSSLGIMKPSQDFDYLIAIDFEATFDNSLTLLPQEIVEFPAILVNLGTRKIEAVFHTFVKPVYHPKLTDFCKRFLGIQQDQVDNGVLLGKALKMHGAWLEENEVKSKRFVVATWSDWDCRTMLDSECLFEGLQKPPYFNRWINLKIPHREVYGNVRANFKQSIELMGLKFEGRPHSGLDDAKNTAYLALELIRWGTRLRVTSWLKGNHLDESKSEFLPTKKRRKRAFTPNKRCGWRAARACKLLQIGWNSVDVQVSTRKESKDFAWTIAKCQYIFGVIRMGITPSPGQPKVDWTDCRNFVKGAPKSTPRDRQAGLPNSARR